MKKITALIGALALSACTAEQGKKVFEALGSGTAIAVANNQAYGLTLDNQDQTKVSSSHVLTMPYPQKASIITELSPDAFAAKGLIAVSSDQVAGTHMKTQFGVFEVRTGKRLALVDNNEIRNDVFGSGSKPKTNGFSMWNIGHACWHSDDEVIIGIEFLDRTPDGQQQRHLIKYELDNTIPTGARDISMHHIGSGFFPNPAPAGYECKEHRLYDTARYGFKNGDFMVDSTKSNQPVALQKLTGAPAQTEGGTAVIFK